MKRKGIRITDDEITLGIGLYDILDEIPYGNSLNWSIFFLDAYYRLDENKVIHIYDDATNQLEKGLNKTWDELNALSKKLLNPIEALIIGTENKKQLIRYSEDRLMYETCDIVIELIDGECWEVFSKDESLINRLAKKFKQTKFLESDFQNK